MGSFHCPNLMCPNQCSLVQYQNPLPSHPILHYMHRHCKFSAAPTTVPQHCEGISLRMRVAKVQNNLTRPAKLHADVNWQIMFMQHDITHAAMPYHESQAIGDFLTSNKPKKAQSSETTTPTTLEITSAYACLSQPNDTACHNPMTLLITPQ